MNLTTPSPYSGGKARRKGTWEQEERCEAEAEISPRGEVCQPECPVLLYSRAMRGSAGAGQNHLSYGDTTGTYLCWITTPTLGFLIEGDFDVQL